MKPPAAWCTALLLGCGAARGAATCDDYVRHSPGGDYTSAADRQGLVVVEKFHFTKDVENLVRGLSATLGGDIGYTLEHFPNHHRALASMARLGLRDKTARPVGARYTVDCYFQRAIRFKRDDATVRSIYGSYLVADGHAEPALEQLQEAVRLAPEQPTINYNIGLMYAKKKDYAQARVHARKAYEQGFPLPGLKNKLIAAGQWQDVPLKARAATPQEKKDTPAEPPETQTTPEPPTPSNDPEL